MMIEMGRQNRDFYLFILRLFSSNLKIAKIYRSEVG